MEIPFDNPESARQFIEEQQAHFKMHHQDLTHQMNDFLAKQSDEDLVLIERMVLAAMDSQHYVGYIRGQIDMLRETKYGMCRCGTNHDEEAANALVPDTTPESTSEDSKPHVELDEDGNLPHEISDEDFQFLMAKYSVEVVAGDLQEHYPTKFRCSVCFTPIVSLEDRMRRPVGTAGCSGCKTFGSQGVKWFGR